MRQIVLSLCLAAGLAWGAAAADFAVSPAELAALDRAINRVANANYVDSQTLGDLVKLRHRLAELDKAPAKAAPEPSDEDAPADLRRLQDQAAKGGRTARRDLALYYLFRGDAENALAEWRLMGKATENDISYTLIAAYLEFALGEYDRGRENIETALRFLDTRVSLDVRNAVFCQNVAGYRVYTPREAGNLLPGEDVLIYAEVEGADFRQNQQGSTECSLMFGLRLTNDMQGTVWREPNYGEYAPEFSGPVRDLHVALSWRVPNTLPPGRYHLTIEAMEESSRRRGQTVLSFAVDRRDTTALRRPTASPDMLDPDTRRQVEEAQMRAAGVFNGGGGFMENRDNNSIWGESRRQGWSSLPQMTNNPQAMEVIKDYMKGQRVQ